MTTITRCATKNTAAPCVPPVTTQRPSDGDGLPELTSLQQDVAGKKLVMDALAAASRDRTLAKDVRERLASVREKLKRSAAE